MMSYLTTYIISYCIIFYKAPVGRGEGRCGRDSAVTLPLSLSFSLSLSLALSLSLTHTLTLSLSLSHTHTLTHTLSLSYTHFLSLSHTHTYSLSHTHTLSFSHTHTLTHSLSHTHSLSIWVGGEVCAGGAGRGPQLPQGGRHHGPQTLLLVCTTSFSIYTKEL